MGCAATMRDVLRLGGPVTLGLCAAFAAAGRSLPPDRGVVGAVSPAPGPPWTPPAEAKKAPEKPPAAPVLPADVVAKGGTLTLAQAIDLSLRNSPVTRDAWLRARAAAAEVGVQRGSWYPYLELD